MNISSLSTSRLGDAGSSATMPEVAVKDELVDYPPTGITATGNTATGITVTAAGATTDLQERTRRLARSGAPSIDTGFGRHAVTGSHGGGSGGSGGGGGDGDDPILMEVRQIKSPPAEGMLNRLHAPYAYPAHAHHANPNVSFVSHGFTAIGDKVKELNDTLGELQSLGIQHVTSLPELVLVGDQSAGKSSLMSGFSDIYLPRSEGACTRCPVHIRLSGSQGGGPWSCRVSLQQDYEYGPPKDVTRFNPFGRWFEKRRDVKDFANLGDPSKIEETLRWAQIATLNPNNDHSLYKPGTGEVWRRNHQLDGEASDAIRNEAAFSPNTVALDISAPGLADLSFYDLPGVFTSARRDEDQYLVKVVENLTIKYISHKQAVILWAVPMNADPETSATFSIIRKQKAQSRTIGIMTKADLLPPNPSATTQWMAMLRGQQHTVGHGYFITARPIVTENLVSDTLVQSSQQDPSRPADELERQGAFEEAFFNKQLPGLANQEWRDCFRDFEDRCGVNRLVAFMSQQLGHEFAKCLPEIKTKVTSKLLDVNYELAQLPDLPENPELEIRRSLAEFATQVRSTLEGPTLSPLLTSAVQQFQHEIAELKPKYIVKVDSMLAVAAAVRAIDVNGHIDLTRDNDDVASLNGGLPVPGLGPGPRLPSGSLSDISRRRRQHTAFLDGQHDTNGPRTPSKRPRGGEPNNYVKVEALPEAGFSPGLTPGRVPFRLGQHHALHSPQKKSSRSLQMVRDTINAKSKPGMPDIVTDDVYNSLCMEAVQLWSTPLMQLLDKIYHLLDAKLHELLALSLSKLRKRLIFKHASSVLKKFVVNQLESVRATLLQQYRLEARKLYTLDSESLRRHQEAETKMLTRHRHHHRMVAYLGEPNGSQRPLPKEWDDMADEERAREKTVMNQELAKLGPDQFKTELAVCAYVRGYYRTASMRFVDTCSLHIMSGLLPDITDKLSKWYLDTQLGVFDRTTPKTFLDLMDEDEATAQKRASLKDDRYRFELTMESIQRLENSSQYSQDHQMQIV